ncbi:MSCRAMM family protein [Duganella sp. S19_KUP01_CR8]|uniref:MSCRAMM family protein n=1 Tax=Duganella sp. S19_KUP01_CR8 TaxID=3025502 RepID=UPI002FCDBE3C
MHKCGQCGKDIPGTCQHDPLVAATPCPLKKGAIWVHVTDDDSRDVAAVPCRGPVSLRTDDTGIAAFDPLPPGTYDIDLDDIANVPALKAAYESPTAPSVQRGVAVSGGEITYVRFVLVRKAEFKVQVHLKDAPGTLLEGAIVSVSGGLQAVADQPTAANGIADFGLVTPGKYQVKVSALKAADAKQYVTTHDFATALEVTLKPGPNPAMLVTVETVNLVKPKLELEYHVVLEERARHQQQAPNEKPILAAPTRVELSFTETNPAHPYTKGAKLEGLAGKADAFLDEACLQPLAGDLTHTQLTQAQPCLLYLRGKAPGLIKLKLTLLDPADRFVVLDDNPTPEQELGVLRVELKMHQQDAAALTALQVDPDTEPPTTYHDDLHAAAWPPQIVMSDADKTGVPSATDAAAPGRLLHVQDGENFGRAKLVCAKIDPAHLPAAAADHELALSSVLGFAWKATPADVTPGDFHGDAPAGPGSGTVSFHDSEVGGSTVASPRAKLSALALNDVTFWVQGDTPTDQVCDLRIEAGIDRAIGGLAKTPKRNGDWVRLTVLKIDEVKLAYVAPAPAGSAPEAWDSGTQRFYINLKADPAGRLLTIGAKLSKPFKNVKIHFALAPDAGNLAADKWGQNIVGGKWIFKDLHADVKHLDKADRKNVLHLSQTTNDTGYAEQELRLSRYGGDKFQPAAYLAEDAHLAKYVAGHVHLQKRKPVFSAHAVTVWRKFWYQEVQVPGVVQANVAAPMAEFENFGVTAVASTPIAFPASRVDTSVAAGTPTPQGNTVSRRAIYPRYMLGFAGDMSDGLVVGDDNVGEFFDAVVHEADKPLKLPVIACDIMLVSDGLTGGVSTNAMPIAAFPFTATMSHKIVKPTINGVPLVAGGLMKFYELTPAGSYTSLAPTAITDAQIVINTTRGANRNNVEVHLPAVLPAGTTHARLDNLQLQAVTSWCGTYYTPAKHLAARIEPAHAADPSGFKKTLMHEVFHALWQVPSAATSGAPKHPHHYAQNGDHCGYAAAACVMCHSAINGVRICPVCDHYLRLQDISRFKP